MVATQLWLAAGGGLAQRRPLSVCGQPFSQADVGKRFIVSGRQMVVAVMPPQHMELVCVTKNCVTKPNASVLAPWHRHAVLDQQEVSARQRRWAAPEVVNLGCSQRPLKRHPAHLQWGEQAAALPTMP